MLNTISNMIGNDWFGFALNAEVLILSVMIVVFVAIDSRSN